MNIFKLLKPKSTVFYLNKSEPLRLASERLRQSGFTAVPVIDDSGEYIGTVSEGDFLWSIVKLRKGESGPTEIDIRELEDISIMDILRKDRNPSVPVTAPMEELLTRAMNQNFIPVTDDLGVLIGIVTRKTIIKYCTENGVQVK